METRYYVIHTRRQTPWEEARQASGDSLTCVRVPQPRAPQGGGTVLWLDDYRPVLPDPEPECPPEPQAHMSRLGFFLDACATVAIAGLSIGLLFQLFG